YTAVNVELRVCVGTSLRLVRPSLPPTPGSVKGQLRRVGDKNAISDGGRGGFPLPPTSEGRYFSSTLAPAASSWALALSACSRGTRSSTGLGAESTRSLASFRPRLARARASLMAWVFLSPGPVRPAF